MTDAQGWALAAALGAMALQMALIYVFGVRRRRKLAARALEDALDQAGFRPLDGPEPTSGLDRMFDGLGGALSGLSAVDDARMFDEGEGVVRRPGGPAAASGETRVRLTERSAHVAVDRRLPRGREARGPSAALVARSPSSPAEVRDRVADAFAPLAQAWVASHAARIGAVARVFDASGWLDGHETRAVRIADDRLRVECHLTEAVEPPTLLARIALLEELADALAAGGPADADAALATSRDPALDDPTRRWVQQVALAAWPDGEAARRVAADALDHPDLRTALAAALARRDDRALRRRLLAPLNADTGPKFVGAAHDHPDADPDRQARQRALWHGPIGQIRARLAAAPGPAVDPVEIPHPLARLAWLTHDAADGRLDGVIADLARAHVSPHRRALIALLDQTGAGPLTEPIEDALVAALGQGDSVHAAMALARRGTHRALAPLERWWGEREDTRELGAIEVGMARIRSGVDPALLGQLAFAEARGGELSPVDRR